MTNGGLLVPFFNLKFNVEIILTKNLPVSSGMGGGSTNAATVFYSLKKLYNLIIKKKDLTNLLFTLGADVPFCYFRKSAIVTGKGEKINFLKNKIFELPVILINPLVEISTKQIFENLDPDICKKKKFKFTEFDSKNFFNYLIEKKDDLQESAEKICPKIKEINNFLKRNTKTKLARMTGSGATCFGIYENTNNAKIAEKLLKAEFKNMWIKRTELINQF